MCNFIKLYNAHDCRTMELIRQTVILCGDVHSIDKKPAFLLTLWGAHAHTYTYYTKWKNDIKSFIMDITCMNLLH